MLSSRFQGQGHSKSSHHQNITISTIVFELLILLKPNWIYWYINISQSVLWKDGIALLKVTVKVQNFNQALSAWYLLKRSTFWNQTWCGHTLSQYHDQECPVKGLVCYLQGQGLGEVSHNQIKLFCFVFWSADPFAAQRSLLIQVLVAKSAVVPHWPSWLRDRWWWWWHVPDGTGFSLCMKIFSLKQNLTYWWRAVRIQCCDISLLDVLGCGKM